MQIMTGTRKEITIRLWQEQLDKYAKRFNDSIECFRRFHEEDDIDRVIEDLEKLIETAHKTKEVVHRLETLGIK